jgi:hypothetical protein
MVDSSRRVASAGAWLVVLLTVLVSGARLGAQEGTGRLLGVSLADALRSLQVAGLRIVFSSELVTPEMRVRKEPRARAAKDRLAELLEPHGLAARTGPGGTILVVRKFRTSAPRTTTAAPDSDAPARGVRDGADPSDDVVRAYVTVLGDAGQDLGPGLARRLESDEVQAFGSHVDDDPLRVAQSLPGVAAGDDFRSEFSVRASPYRHAAVLVDGVPVPWLQHAALGREPAGTLTMLRNDLVQDATLSVGAYARRDSSQLGPSLSLTLREGSRTATAWRLGTSDSAATMTAEGPIGSSGRGSWLIGFRKSYVEWPLKRDDHNATVFGFADLQSKAVYDVRPNHQLSVSVVSGLSNVERDDQNPAMLGDGTNRAALAIVALRSLVGQRTAVRQQVSFQAHRFENRLQDGRAAGSGSNRAHAYRADVTRAVGGHLLESGIHVRRLRGSSADAFSGVGADPRPAALPVPGHFDRSWWERAAYASFRWTGALGVTVASGLRLADSTLVGQRALDRWAQVEWSGVARWRVYASAGVGHQLAALEQVAGTPPEEALRPERATYVDLGIGHDLTSSVRWGVTAFARRERDILRGPYLAPLWLVRGVATDPYEMGVYDNALSGRTYGVELMLERRGRSGLSGWAGYAFNVARHADEARQETFRADFDQRHSVNIAGAAPLGRATRVGATFRAGTSRPIPGYVLVRDRALAVSGVRNGAELPAYARLDLRADRTFELERSRLVLFAEVLNLLGRANYGLTRGVIVAETGQMSGFTEPLFSRLITGGVRLEF